MNSFLNVHTCYENDRVSFPNHNNRFVASLKLVANLCLKYYLILTYSHEWENESLRRPSTSLFLKSFQRKLFKT